MKAVVLAAGRGTRLGELARQTPKALLLVGGEPLLARILRGIAGAGVAEAAVVTGHLGERIRQACPSGAIAGVRIQWFEQPAPEGTARAVARARAFLGDGSFLFAWGDIAVEPSNYRAVVEAAAAADGALAVNEVADPAAGAAVEIGADGFVRQILEKPPPGTSSTPWNNAGIGVLPAAVWGHIDALQASPRGEYELPQAIDALARSGCRLRAVPIAGPWFDIGTPESLAAARAAFGGT
jgi:NDP-sugar pyrophosphorylase family protein